MNWLKRSSCITTLAGLLALGLAINPSALVQAQPTSVSSKIPENWEFEPPKGVGSPEGREGGATRGSPKQSCISDENQDLITIAPLCRVGKTVAEYPTLYWYLPQTSAPKIEFQLLTTDTKSEDTKSEDKERQVYSATFTLAQSQPGIMSLQLSALPALLPLEIGKEYHWQVKLIGEGNEQLADNKIARGWIERVKRSPSLPSRIGTTPLEKRLAVYAQSRLWYETVATLVELRRLHPNDLAFKNDWAKLLKSVGMEQTSENPVVVKRIVSGGTESTPESPKPSSNESQGEER